MAGTIDDKDDFRGIKFGASAKSVQGLVSTTEDASTKRLRAPFLDRLAVPRIVNASRRG